MDGPPVAEYPTVLLFAADAAATIGRPPRSHALISFPFLMCSANLMSLISVSASFRLKNSADFALMDPVAPAETPLRMLPRS